MVINEVSSKNWEAEVLASNKPVLADFHATWCGPCKALATTLEILALKYSEKIRFVRVDIEQNRDLGIKYDVKSLPYMLLFDKGQIKLQAKGNLPGGEIERRINSVLGYK